MSFQDISVFDLALVVLMIIFGFKGAFNGFIKETFGLVGLIGGIYLASRFAQKTGLFIDQNIYNIDNKSSIYFIGFVATLVLFWLFAIVLGVVFTKLVRLSGLGFINKILGFLTGSLKIFLLFAIVVFALKNIEFFKYNIDTKLQKSYSYPYLISFGKYIVNFKPDDIKKKTYRLKKELLDENKSDKDLVINN